MSVLWLVWWLIGWVCVQSSYKWGLVNSGTLTKTTLLTTVCKLHLSLHQSQPVCLSLWAFNYRCGQSEWVVTNSLHWYRLTELSESRVIWVGRLTSLTFQNAFWSLCLSWVVWLAGLPLGLHELSTNNPHHPKKYSWEFTETKRRFGFKFGEAN